MTNICYWFIWTISYPFLIVLVLSLKVKSKCKAAPVCWGRRVGPGDRDQSGTVSLHSGYCSRQLVMSVISVMISALRMKIDLSVFREGKANRSM